MSVSSISTTVDPWFTMIVGFWPSSSWHFDNGWLVYLLFYHSFLKLLWKTLPLRPHMLVLNVPFLWHFIIWTGGEWISSKVSPNCMMLFSRHIILRLNIVHESNFFDIINKSYTFCVGFCHWYAWRKGININRSNAQDGISQFSSWLSPFRLCVSAFFFRIVLTD